MSTQHTPGPWHVSKASPTRVIESGPRGNSIAKMGLNLGACSQEEAEANARLIAAAPDLLEALQGMLLGFSLTQNPDAYPSDAPCNKARAAIAKATRAA